MKIYVLDANAMVRFMAGTADSHKIRALFDKARAADARLMMSVVNWGEVIYRMAKRIGITNAVADLKSLGAALETIGAGVELAEEAASLKHHYKLGYGDSFAAALAMQMKATFATADSDFERLGKRFKILALTRHVS